jgi:hypothetical protein
MWRHLKVIFDLTIPAVPNMCLRRWNQHDDAAWQRIAGALEPSWRPTAGSATFPFERNVSALETFVAASIGAHDGQAGFAPVYDSGRSETEITVTVGSQPGL